MMQTVVDIRMMAAAGIPAVPGIQAVCYTEVMPAMIKGVGLEYF